MLIINYKSITYYIEYRTKLNYDSGLKDSNKYPNAAAKGDYHESILIRMKDSQYNSILIAILPINTFFKVDNLFISHYSDRGNIIISNYELAFSTNPSISTILHMNYMIFFFMIVLYLMLV